MSSPQSDNRVKSAGALDAQLHFLEAARICAETGGEAKKKKGVGGERGYSIIMGGAKRSTIIDGTCAVMSGFLYSPPCCFHCWASALPPLLPILERLGMHVYTGVSI